MTTVVPLTQAHWLDFVIIGVVIFSGFVGFLRGFTRELLSIGCWILSGIIARLSLPFGRELLEHSIKNTKILNTVVLVSAFIISLIVLKILLRSIVDRVRSSMLSSLDRSMGTIFGMGRGLLVICLFYASILSMLHKKPDIMHKVRLEPVLMKGAEIVARFISPEAQLAIKAQAHDLKEKSTEAVKSSLHSANIFHKLMHTIPQQSKKVSIEKGTIKKNEVSHKKALSNNLDQLIDKELRNL